MRIRYIIVALALLTSAVLSASEDVVAARGVGSTRREALNEALISAVEQHEGGAVASTVRSGMSAAQHVSVTTDDGRMTASAMQESIGSDMRKYPAALIIKRKCF